MRVDPLKLQDAQRTPPVLTNAERLPILDREIADLQERICFLKACRRDIAFELKHTDRTGRGVPAANHQTKGA